MYIPYIVDYYLYCIYIHPIRAPVICYCQHKISAATTLYYYWEVEISVYSS